MEQLYGSKTGIQGEADGIITIGRRDSSSNERTVFVPKNKLPDGNNSMRNVRFHVDIDPNTTSFTER